MSAVIALYSVLLVVGCVAALVVVGMHGLDQWRHRTEDGERLAARLTARRTGGGAVTTAGQRMHLDLGLALAGYGFAFAGDLVARGLSSGWHPSVSAWWALVDAVIAAALHVLVNRDTGRARQRRPALLNGSVLMATAAVLGVVGGLAGM
jgi:hypothetical protein